MSKPGALPKCDMHRGCEAEVTHIGSKGYVYCTAHAPIRGDYESSRRMREWERDLLRQGKVIPSYQYRGKPVSA